MKINLKTTLAALVTAIGYLSSQPDPFNWQNLITAGSMVLVGFFARDVNPVVVDTNPIKPE